MKKIKHVGESCLETMSKAITSCPQTIEINQEFTHFTHAINVSFKNNAAKL